MKRQSVSTTRISITQLAQGQNRVNFPPQASYLLSYREFVHYFADLKVITPHNVVIGAFFSYGWMPTILDLYSADTLLPVAVALLNQAKAGTVLSEADVTLLHDFINHSIVGASKVLHFVNPSCYAIYDSRVSTYLSRETGYTFRVNDVSDFFRYLTICKELAQDPAFPPIQAFVSQQVGYPVSAYRAIELIMYQNSR